MQAKMEFVHKKCFLSLVKMKKMYKKLLENEKLIRTVLSKYPEIKLLLLKQITVKDCAAASLSGIHLGSSWLKKKMM